MELLKISCGAGECRYGAQYRPISFCTAPGGWTRTEPARNHERSVARHGVVVYSSPLTAEQIKAFELAVLADEQGDEALAAAVAGKLSRYAKAYLKSLTDGTDLLEQSVHGAIERCVPYVVVLNDEKGFAQKVIGLLKSMAVAA